MIWYSVACLMFLSLFVFSFFLKNRIKTYENKIFSKLLIISEISLIIEIVCFVTVSNINQIPIINLIANKLLLLSYLLYSGFFTNYVYQISVDDTNLNKNGRKVKVNIIGIIYFLVNSIIILLLPINFINNSGKMYSYGSAVDYLFITYAILIIIWIIIMIKNKKKIKNKKYIPIFILIILGILAGVIQKMYPYLTLMTGFDAIVVAIMFFTIENPDIQMMEELYKNKKIIEKSNQDTSNFMFKMTQDIKKPVKDMINLSKELIGENDLSNVKEGLKQINNDALDLSYLINDALDVSSMNTRRIKIYDTRYNPNNLFSEIKYKCETLMPQDVKLEYSISNSIPEYLYGDSIKIKQVIFSILDNSIKNTLSGYINLDVSAIVKYDICRLIITISDTGSGISIDKINEILSLNSDDVILDEDKQIYNLREVKKIVNMLGGSLMIKSESNKGTTTNIVLEQKIVETKKTEMSKKLEIYEQALYKNKKIMVVDDDAKELSKITSYLEKKYISVNGSLYGRDVIERISNKYNYDLIILDDQTDTYSALDVLKELQKNKKFNTPVVVMIDDSKEFIKLYYLQDGFADVILKSKLNKELDRILKRF